MSSTANLYSLNPLETNWRIDACDNPFSQPCINKSKQSEAYEDAELVINIHDNRLTESANPAKQNISFARFHPLAKFVVSFASAARFIVLIPLSTF